MLIEITVYVRYVNVVTWLLCVEFIYGLSYCALCLFYFAYSDWLVIFMDNLICQIFVSLVCTCKFSSAIQIVIVASTIQSLLFKLKYFKSPLRTIKRRYTTFYLSQN